jgi:hypothetical protein
MTEDEKRESLKNAGLPPHVINEVLRQADENKAHAEEVYQYVKEIMDLDNQEISHVLFTAFWKALHDEVQGLNHKQISLVMSLVSMSFTSRLKELIEETNVSGDHK